MFESAEKENLLKDLPFEILIALFSGAVISLAKVYKAGKFTLDDQVLSAVINVLIDKNYSLLN